MIKTKFSVGDIIREYNVFWKKHIVYLVLDVYPSYEDIRDYFITFPETEVHNDVYKLLPLDNEVDSSIVFIDIKSTEEDFEKLV